MDDNQEKLQCESLKKNLSDKIWITRKNHIEASERLLKSASYVEFINVYYSIVLILFSLLSVSPYAQNKSLLISYISLSGSIVLTISIIFANSLNYRQRALALKKSYISLQLLLAELENSNAMDSEKIMEIEKKYTELLGAVENHKRIDFIRVIRNNKVDGHSIENKDENYFIFYGFLQFIWKASLVILPIVALYFVMR